MRKRVYDPDIPANLAPGKPADEGDLIISRRYRLVSSLSPSRGGLFLDFGCGNGAQTFLFAEDFPLLAGVDIGISHLRQLRIEAERKGLGGKIIPIRYDGYSIPLSDSSVDYCVSFEVLEHVKDEKRVLCELARVLKPGGILAVSVPNRWWIFETHGADLPLLPWNRIPFFSWLPRAIHDRYARARIYTKREIIGKLRESGLEIIRDVYVTAPMDVVRWSWLKRTLRSTIFRKDSCRLPVLSTAILVVAEKR
ncbi:MAG: methyltransferase domain-containing protein [Candidatus Krumholzibacteriota bacterium]|nr:methyltransferase domain-containing protein [Candidatus Krumholzibacteriota bacterium]